MKQIRKTITKAEIVAMPKVLFPGRIFVIYTESEAEKAVASRTPSHGSGCRGERQRHSPTGGAA